MINIFHTAFVCYVEAIKFIILYVPYFDFEC